MRLVFRAWLVAFAVAFVGASALAAESQPVDPAMREVGIYIVQPGDTCLDVAKKVWPGESSAIDKLHEFNQMGPLPHNLVPGTRLRTISNVPDATVTFVKPDVNIRKGGKPSWLMGNVGEGLFHLDQLTTLAGASAEVLFRDKSSLQLDQNALITIYETAMNSKRQQRSGAIELLHGDMRLSLSSLRGEKGGMEVKTPGAQVAATGAIFTVGVDAQKMSRVSVFDGTANVAAQGTSIDVKHGFGTRVQEGTPPEPPQPLPSTPAWTTGGRHDVLLAVKDTTAVSFKWGDGVNTVRYQFEVATDEKFNSRIIIRSIEASAPHAVDLPVMGIGRYFARVSGYSASGLVGPPSVLKVVDVARLTVESGAPGRDPGTIVGAVQIRVRLPDDVGAHASVDGVPVSGNPVVIEGMGTHKLRVYVGDAITVLDAIVQRPQCRAELTKDLKQVIVQFYDLQGHKAWFPVVGRELQVKGFEGTSTTGSLKPEPTTRDWRTGVIPFRVGDGNFGANIRVYWSSQEICSIAK